jgi:hypothetical protein
LFGVRQVPLWLALLAAMYRVCGRYAEFKSTKPPTSLWRFL